jgi:hypothetical protein
LLPNGQELIASGDLGNGLVSDGELYDPIPNPILAFSFDNVTSSNITDDSNSGNSYTITATDLAFGPFIPTTVDSFSGSGKAMQYNGLDEQRIEVSGAALTVNAFTIMADVNITGNDTDPAHTRWEVCEKSGSYWANIRYGPPKILRVGGFFSGHQTNSFRGSVAIVPGVWTNVAFVFDPVAHKLQTYVNGVFDHEQRQNGTLDTSISHNGIDENLVVGAKHRQGGGDFLEAFFDGLMDNYRLFDTPLTATQIASLSGIPVATPTPTPTPTPAMTTVKVAARPMGRSFSVDAIAYTTTQTFSWETGSSHTIATTSPQSGPSGIQYVWTKWSDNGAISHVVAPTTNTNYLASFSPSSR